MLVLGAILVWFLFSFLHQGYVNNKSNPYIEKHKQKNNNDYYYNSYLKWCEKNNEIPMNKQVFIKEVEDKENYIKNLL